MSTQSSRGLVVAIVAGSGVVLTVIGAVMVALGANTLVGAVLMVAGIGDLIAAFVLRARMP